jgi:cyclopropane-fatty-acyl-phospholipid synthase
MVVNPLLSAVERKLQAISIPVQLRMPDGTQLGASDPRVALTVRSKSALAHLVAGEVGILGQDYVEGQLDFDGNMHDVMQATAQLLPASPMGTSYSGRFTGLIRWLSSVWHHSIERDARQIEFHYDLSDDFYALWLDPRRVYSCAYYRTLDTTSLAQAQEAKLDLICRKLQLVPGERFLDIGAGWGGLLLWAAENYGVHATGLTLSRNQHAYVQKLIQEKGLQKHIRMELLDYRKLDESQPFDKIASVGMFEHVGRSQLASYFTKLRRLLRPGGLMMNHGITAGGIHHAQLGSGMGQFIGKYIFPGGELTHISRVMKAMACGGLEALDVENLRPHYARTLWAWSDNLEQNLAAAAKLLPGEQGARSLRAYRLYLPGCAMAFEHGWLALHQVLGQGLAPACADALDRASGLTYPWRRDYMYGNCC